MNERVAPSLCLDLPPWTGKIIGVAGLLWIACAGCRTATTAPAQPPAVAAPTADAPLSVAVKTHALAFGAILDSQRNDPHSRLVPISGTPGFEEKVEGMKELLANQWRLHNREELLALLDGLQNGDTGQRQDYWTIRRTLLEAKMENYGQVISSGAGGASAFIVATHLAPLRGFMPIAAWDFGRYINLCRWGAECGWITEQEAWDRILPAARLLQTTYTSWDDYAADYLLGRNFWNPQTGIADNETLRYIITLLNLPPKGLWSTIDWNEPLGTGPVLTDKLAAKLLDHYKDPDPNAVTFEHVPDQNPVLMVLRTSVDPK